MNKEQLVELGLDEDQIKEVFRLNGIAVNNAKGDLDTKETELASLRTQLEEANTQIDGFKDLDVEGIKAATEEYKTKFEEAKIKAEQDIEALKFEHELEGAIRDSKAKNVKAVKALLDIDNLKGSNNRVDDIKAALEATKADNDYLFKDEAPQGTGGSLGNTGKNGASITKEDFENMEYTDKVALYNKNIELYKELSK